MIKITKLLLLLLIVLPLVGLGCGQKVAEQAAENRINNAIDNQGEFEYTGNGWQYEDEETGTKVQVGENVSIPVNFPDDVPLYPNAQTRSVSYNPEQGLYGFLVLVSKDSVEDVMGWYSDQASKNGWTQNGSFNSDGVFMEIFTQDNRTLNISTAPAEDEADFTTLTTITITEM